MRDDLKTRAAQHGAEAGPIRDPPVGAVARISMLDEMHPGVTGRVEDAALREGIVFLEVSKNVAASLHALNHEQVTHGVLVQKVEGEEGVAQVVENAHEENEIERLSQVAHVIDVEV